MKVVFGLTSGVSELPFAVNFFLCFIYDLVFQFPNSLLHCTTSTLQRICSVCLTFKVLPNLFKPCFKR